MLFGFLQITATKMILTEEKCLQVWMNELVSMQSLIVLWGEKGHGQKIIFNHEIRSYSNLF